MNIEKFNKRVPITVSKLKYDNIVTTNIFMF